MEGGTMMHTFNDMMNKLSKTDPEQFKKLMKFKENEEQAQIAKELERMNNKERLHAKINSLSSKRNSKQKDAMLEFKKDEYMKKVKEKEDAIREKKRLRNQRRRHKKKELQRAQKANEKVESEFIEVLED